LVPSVQLALPYSSDETAPFSPKYHPFVPKAPRRRGRLRGNTTVFRRVNRTNETDSKTVRRAIPEGSVRAANTGQALRALTAAPRYALMNSNRRAGVHTILSLLARFTDYESMTSRPGHENLSRLSGIPLSTLRRHIRTLRDMGLLGLVANGRMALFAEAGPDGKKTAEAAVYVLCVPAPFAAAQNAPRTEAVEETEHPSRVSGSLVKELKEPTHAREPKTKNRGSNPIPEDQDLPQRRSQVTHWPENRPTSSKRQRYAAGAQLRSLSPALRALSLRDVASSCRDHLLAGYTVRDILHAIDHTPEGPRGMLSLTREDGPARVRGWLRWRLAAWRDEHGDPVPSRSQRARQDAERVRATAVAERERILAERAERAERLRRGPSLAMRDALQQIRATLAKTQD
jgi:DNA-binding transcriptional ArsR family regulator